MYKIIIVLLSFSSLLLGQKASKSSLLKSIIIPGWGNYSLNDKSTAYVHLGIEAVSWIGYFYNDIQFENAKKDYKSFVNLKLGISSESYSETYYDIIGQYVSYEQYVEFQKRQGNDLTNLISESDSWNWESEENRRRYAFKRKETINLDRKFKYFFATMGLNRLISILTTQKARKKLLVNAKLNETVENGQQLQLNLTYSF